MEVFELIEEMLAVIDESKGLPFTNKKAIDGAVLEEIINEIKEKMPEEVKQARWIKEERTRIIQQANKEADEILKKAENRIIEMIDEHEITKQAYEKREKIIEDAKIQSREITEGTKKYTDEILASAEKKVSELNNQLIQGQEIIQRALQTLESNRKEYK